MHFEVQVADADKKCCLKQVDTSLSETTKKKKKTQILSNKNRLLQETLQTSGKLAVIQLINNGLYLSNA